MNAPTSDFDVSNFLVDPPESSAAPAVTAPGIPPADVKAPLLACDAYGAAAPRGSGSLPWTGRLSFSLFKKIGQSPADFLYACTHPIEATANMRLGTLVHYHLLGGSAAPLIYRGKGTRAAAEYKAWAAKYEGEELFTAAEDNEAIEIATAVRTAPHNRHLYEKYIVGGEYEIPLEWEMLGFQFATRGVDILQRVEGRLTDYKTVMSSRQRKLRYLAADRNYAEQLVCYGEALAQNGFEAQSFHNVCTHTKPPYITRVITHSPAAIECAKKVLVGWAETLRKCLDTGEWPGSGAYEQDEFTLEGGPIAVTGIDDLEEGED